MSNITIEDFFNIKNRYKFSLNFQKKEENVIEYYNFFNKEIIVIYNDRHNIVSNLLVIDESILSFKELSSFENYIVSYNRIKSIEKFLKKKNEDINLCSCI